MRRSKYGNRKVRADGFVFDSKAEAARYQALCLLEKAGRITKLEVHPVYELQGTFKQGGKTIRAITYEADFCYFDEFGKIAVEDVKGMRTEVFRIKEKLFRKLYPYLDLRILDVRSGSVRRTP